MKNYKTVFSRDDAAISARVAEALSVAVTFAMEHCPAECGLLIVTRCNHNSWPHEHRFFAVRRGRLSLGWTTVYGRERAYEIGDQPVEHVLADLDRDYEADLPAGSREFVDGAWVDRNRFSPL